VKIAKRPVTLPDFIPRYGLDKNYGTANPGWDRYKGQVTEFKVFRENGAIKAIQIIDRGGQGVPESFM
jgi:flagellar FliL protein